MPKIVFIDHYDSFSFNVLDWLWRAGIAFSEIEHVYFDDFDRMGEVASKNCPIVIGPGPHSPIDAKPTLNLMKDLVGKVPVFGICLGHQILGVLSGGRVTQAKSPWHGKPVLIQSEGQNKLFSGIDQQFSAACYNSLVIEYDVPPKGWQITCRNSDCEIMGLERIAEGPSTYSVQFHPESFNTPVGIFLAKNWLNSMF